MTRSSTYLASLAATAVLGSCLFLNLDGYQIHLYSPWGLGEVAAEPPIINWVHGWPVGCTVRASAYSVNAGKGVPVASFTGDAGSYSRWPLDDSPVFVHSTAALLTNIAFLVLVVPSTFLGVGRLADRYGWRMRFSMRMLLLVMTIACISLVSRNYIFGSRMILEAIAVTVVLMGMCLGVVAFCMDCQRLSSRLWGSSRREVATPSN